MPSEDAPLRLLPFRGELAATFREINEEWISSMFEIEESDRALLDAPQESILDAGGFIWFVEHDALGVIGTCAVMPRQGGAYELTKMGVLERARGLKAGEFLLRAVLDESRSRNLRPLFLLTNSTCEAAIHLYRKHGFVDDEEIMRRYAGSYDRCDVAMLWRPSR